MKTRNTQKRPIAIYNEIRKRFKPKWFLSLLFILNCCAISLAQTMTGATVLTPICPTGSGTVQVSFTGATFPFELVWYGSNIAQGKATITGSPQTITMAGQTYGGNSTGTSASFFTKNYSTYLGNYALGINFDPISSSIKADCANGATFVANNIKGGTAPYALVLYNKITGSPIASGNSPLNVAFSTVCPLNGNIGLKIEDATGCYASLDSLDINCNGLNIQITNTNASCTNGTAQVVSVSGGVSPYTYAWSNAATSSSITGLSSGNYHCIVTDSKGCSGIGYTYIAQTPTLNLNLTSSPATCNNPDGKSMVFVSGGTAPYTYFWDNGATTQSVSNLKEGYHTVNIKDINGCIALGYVYINTNSPVTVSYTATASSCTGATGTATLSTSGGTTPYTYVWDGLSFTGNTATGLAVGQYSFTVTDANDCVRRGIVIIPPISQINATINGNDIICPNTRGSLQVNAFSKAAPLTYKWSNGSTTAAISNVLAGNYTCVITDTNNCTITKSKYLGTTSSINLGFNTTPASCIFASDGSITVAPTGGTAPYNYKWSNGASTATITGLKHGYYWVEVSDANGCRYNKSFNFVNLSYNPANTSCYCTIEGIVYNDLNSNCNQDAGEDGISDVLINGGTLGYTCTNNNGYYSFKAPIGNYTITETLDKGVSLTSCQSNGIAVSVTSVGGGCTKNVSFSNQLAPVHDIVIALFNTNLPRPGNTFNQQLFIKNRGNITESTIEASFFHDGQFQWINSAKTPWVSAGKDFFNLNPIPLKKGETQIYYLDYSIPTNVPLGTLAYFRDSAAYTSPIATHWLTNEETPWNNISDLYTTVVNSYDPNSKSVYPQGIGEQGKIPLTTDEFRYVVHFENNGTAPALQVVVTDTLDVDLDISTFRTLGASHNFETHINNGLVTFTFKNINLDYTPYGVYNAKAQGFVTYTIKAKNSVVLGTKLESKADIYFDYNPPIATNKPVNTYFEASGSSHTIGYSENKTMVYPNPNNGLFKLLLPEHFMGVQNIAIYSLQGQLLQTIQLSNKALTLDLTALAKGMYIAKIQSENGHFGSVKFQKQ